MQDVWEWGSDISAGPLLRPPIKSDGGALRWKALDVGILQGCSHAGGVSMAGIVGCTAFAWQVHPELGVDEGFHCLQKTEGESLGIWLYPADLYRLADTQRLSLIAGIELEIS